jgi:predicted ATPase
VRDDLPTGTVTLLFTDIEGSTRLIESLGEEAYVQALAEHRRLLRSAFSAHRGVEVDTQGDAFLYAFADPGEALAAAARGQGALGSGAVTVRMGLHTGEVRLTSEGYAGRELHRAARIAASAHGGQVVLSAATRELVEGDLTELGEHRLKDFDEPVALFQLGDARFPPLKTISNTNLPRPASSFVGRDREREELLGRLQNGSRLVTLSGPGGSGKTRLAIEVASELVPVFKAGVFWVGLAPLRDAALVMETVAQTLGAKDGVAEHIAERELLLVLDNLEHVVDVAPELSQLLEACRNLRLLVTSREVLRIAGEVECPVPPLATPEAVELFCQRSQCEPDETITKLCRRLDNMPLAVELAAARTSALTPAQILDRLWQRLDLLKGGRDVDPRQQTLRATIEWSHDLLSVPEQQLFARLAIFAGGCTLDAAEDVCGADLDILQSLVDKSLLRHTGERFWMLETIRELAVERLQSLPEARDLAERHVRHYLDQLEKNDAQPSGSIAERLAWFALEEDNLRAMLGRLTAMPSDAAQACELLFPYWWARAAYLEAREQFRATLDLAGLGKEPQTKLLGLLTKVHVALGDLDAADAAATGAVATAEGSGRHDLLASALTEAAWVPARQGRKDDALRLIRRAADVAESLDDRTRLAALHDLAALLGEARQAEEARAFFQQTMELARKLGDTFAAISTLIQVGFIDLDEQRFDEARTRFASALDENLEVGHYGADVWGRWGLGYALLRLGQRREARTTFAEALDLVLAAPQSITAHVGLSVSGVAHAAEPENARTAARLRGAVSSLRAQRGWHEDPRIIDQDRIFDQLLIATLGEEAWAQEQAAGAAMTFDEATQLARSLGVSGAGDSEWRDAVSPSGARPSPL